MKVQAAYSVNGILTAYSFSSSHYSFCTAGPLDKDWPIRSSISPVPFDQDFNRMVLRVRGMTASHYWVEWTNQQDALEGWRSYTGEELAAGINLANDSQLNPLSTPFRRIDDLVSQKQMVEFYEIWQAWEGQGK